MNYEGKYKQALARARAWCKVKSGDTTDELQMAEYIFPELVQEKDEQIRKDLINHLKICTLDIFANHKPKDIIAWLEKQKQNTSTFTKEDEAYQNGYHDCEKDLANKLDANKVIEWIRYMKIAKGCKIVHICDEDIVKQFKKDFGL